MNRAGNILDEHPVEIRIGLSLLLIILVVAGGFLSPAFPSIFALAMAAGEIAYNLYLRTESRPYQIIEASLSRARWVLRSAKIDPREKQDVTESLLTAPGRDKLRNEAREIGRRLQKWDPLGAFDPEKLEIQSEIERILAEIERNYSTMHWTTVTEAFEKWCKWLLLGNYENPTQILDIMNEARNMPEHVISGLTVENIPDPEVFFARLRPEHLTSLSESCSSKLLEKLEPLKLVSCIEGIVSWLQPSCGILVDGLFSVLEVNEINAGIRERVMRELLNKGASEKSFYRIGYKSLEQVAQLDENQRTVVLLGRLRNSEGEQEHRLIFQQLDPENHRATSSVLKTLPNLSGHSADDAMLFLTRSYLDRTTLCSSFFKLARNQSLDKWVRLRAYSKIGEQGSYVELQKLGEAVRREQDPEIRDAIKQAFDNLGSNLGKGPQYS